MQWHQVVLVGIYQINKTYITQKYCINKLQPEKHCNGQCHLQKQLSKSEDETNSTSLEIKWKELELFIQNNYELEIIVNSRFKNSHQYYYCFTYNNPSYKIEAPPPQLFI